MKDYSTLDLQDYIGSMSIENTFNQYGAQNIDKAFVLSNDLNITTSKDKSGNVINTFLVQMSTRRCIHYICIIYTFSFHA